MKLCKCEGECLLLFNAKIAKQIWIKFGMETPWINIQAHRYIIILVLLYNYHRYREMTCRYRFFWVYFHLKYYFTLSGQRSWTVNNDPPVHQTLICIGQLYIKIAFWIQFKLFFVFYRYEFSCERTKQMKAAFVENYNWYWTQKNSRYVE